jgi:hypothetical protein
VIASRRGGLAESAALDGVRAIEPTVDELRAALDGSLPRPGPADEGDRERERWLDAHAQLLERAAA